MLIVLIPHQLKIHLFENCFKYSQSPGSEVNLEELIKNRQHFLEQPIWHNSLIKTDGKTVFDKQVVGTSWSVKDRNLMKDYSSNFLNLLSL